MHRSRPSTSPCKGILGQQDIPNNLKDEREKTVNWNGRTARIPVKVLSKCLLDRVVPLLAGMPLYLCENPTSYA